MGNSVTDRREGVQAGFGGGAGATSAGSLFLPDGRRKYLTQAERQRVLAAFAALPREQALFAETLAWTGARISEVLALTPASFDLAGGLVALHTLKRRRFVMREVPLPPALVRDLDACFRITEAQRERRAGDRLWPFSRTTAWRFVKSAMDGVGVSGRSACPRGLRHGFGVGSLQAGVPVTLVQHWLGHARLSTTAIYAEVSGPEERALAQRYWEWAGRLAS